MPPASRCSQMPSTSRAASSTCSRSGRPAWGRPCSARSSLWRPTSLFKARASGADAVLLIAAVLPNADLAYLVKASAKCSLQVLVEVHSVAGVPTRGSSFQVFTA